MPAAAGRHPGACVACRPWPIARPGGDRPISDLGGTQPSVQCLDRADVRLAAAGDTDLGSFTGRIDLGAGDHQPKTGQRRPDMGRIKADKLGASQRPGETDQNEGAIPKSRQIIAADTPFDQPPDLGRGQSGGAPGQFATGARAAAQRLADRRMPCVRGLLGDPVCPRDGGDPATEFCTA